MSLGAAIGGALGNLAGGFLNNASQFTFNKSLAKYQAKLNYQYAQKSAENSPSWTRKGLTSAGYNPMLAVQNATSGANSSWTNASGVQGADTGHLGSDMISNAQSFKHLENETNTAESTADMNYANADKAKAEKAAIIKKLPFISKREEAEIANIDKDSLLKESKIHNLDETTRFIQKRYELDKALGFAGLDVQRYGYDKDYQGRVYNSDTMKEIADNHSPSGKSQSFKNYTSGVRDIVGSVSDFMPWKRGSNYDYDETTRVVHDKNQTYTKRSRRRR